MQVLAFDKTRRPFLAMSLNVWNGVVCGWSAFGVAHVYVERRELGGNPPFLR